MTQSGTSGRILYFLHDDPLPAGGVRTIYAHVEHLNRNGFAAFAVHQMPGFKPTWFSNSVPALYFESGLQVTPADVLVIPENLGILAHLKQIPIRKVIFCQNHFYAFSALPEGETWRSLGITRVIAAAEVIAHFMTNDHGWSNVPVVHYAIDPALFTPRPKKPQIAYMPRKLLKEVQFIRGAVTAALGPASEWKWVELDNMSIDRVAATLSESAIFLSLSHLEGFGLPPVEAMSAGCAVVGFHGYGGLEYATKENGFWCEEGNPMACASMLRSVIDLFSNNDNRLHSVIEAGRRTAARYTAERQEREVVEAMRRVLTNS